MHSFGIYAEKQQPKEFVKEIELNNPNLFLWCAIQVLVYRTYRAYAWNSHLGELQYLKAGVTGWVNELISKSLIARGHVVYDQTIPSFDGSQVRFYLTPLCSQETFVVELDLNAPTIHTCMDKQAGKEFDLFNLKFVLPD